MPPQLITLEPDGEGYVDGYDWYIRSSVVNALWGQVMGRLAAKVWLAELGFGGHLKFPPASAEREPIWPPDLLPAACDAKKNLCAYKIEGAALKEFWTALAEIAFPPDEPDYGTLWPGGEFNLPPEDEMPPGIIRCLDPDQRQILLVLRYFEPGVYGANKKRMKVRVIYAEAYDFVLHRGGLDLFVPPKPYGQTPEDPKPLGLDPGKTTEEVKNQVRTRYEILRMYKFRETGAPPIGLSGVPATSSEEGRSYLVPVTATPTGPTDVPHDWMRGMAAGATWWITGSIYAAMNQALPRLVASLWFEQHVKGPPSGDDQFALSYTARWQTGGGVLGLLQHRLETRLNCELELGDPSDESPDTRWNPRDLMITDKGLVIPYPGTKGPEVKKMLEDIMAGTAGNPVFTNTIPNGGE